MQTPNLPAIRALRPAWNKGRIFNVIARRHKQINQAEIAA